MYPKSDSYRKALAAPLSFAQCETTAVAFERDHAKSKNSQHYVLLHDENESVLTLRSILISKTDNYLRVLSLSTDGTLHNTLKELGLKLILARNARPPKYVFDDVNELLSLHSILSKVNMTFCCRKLHRIPRFLGTGDNVAHDLRLSCMNRLISKNTDIYNRKNPKVPKLRSSS